MKNIKQFLVAFTATACSLLAQNKGFVVSRDEGAAQAGIIKKYERQLYPVIHRVGAVYEDEIRDEDALSIRAHFKIDRSSPMATWAVRLVSDHGERWEGSSLFLSGRSEFWSASLHGSI